MTTGIDLGLEKKFPKLKDFSKLKYKTGNVIKVSQQICMWEAIITSRQSTPLR